MLGKPGTMDQKFHLKSKQLLPIHQRKKSASSSRFSSNKDLKRPLSVGQSFTALQKKVNQTQISSRTKLTAVNKPAATQRVDTSNDFEN